MRIRQIRPEFWTDPVTGRLSHGARLFYIGLWNVADDAGFLDWDPDAIGAVLLPYELPDARPELIAEWARSLIEAKRLVVLDCGCGVVPTLSRHQRITGKQAFTVRDRHLANHPEPKRRPHPEDVLRDAILARDGLNCRFCAKDLDRNLMVLAHIDPAGPRTVENLVVACRRCNYIQGSRTPEEAGMTLLDPPIAPRCYQALTDSPVTVGNGRERNGMERNGTDGPFRVIEGRLTDTTRRSA